MQHSSMASITAVVAGAGLAGLLAWVMAPELFPAALIGGALVAGAVRVTWLLFATGGKGGNGRS